MSDIFEEELEELEEESELLEEEPLREWGVDFKTGQLTGRLVEGSEAVKVWAWNALNTNRYRHVAHSWFYGHDFDELIGQRFSKEYLDEQVKGMVRECLLVNPNIEDVRDIVYEMEEDKLNISCKLDTVFGEEELDV